MRRIYNVANTSLLKILTNFRTCVKMKHFSRIRWLTVVMLCVDARSEDTGTPTGFLSDCPGLNNSIAISAKTLRTISVTVHTGWGQAARRKSYRFPDAAAKVLRDGNIDFAGKRTVVYFDGYLDSVDLPHIQGLSDAYSKQHYNVILLQTSSIFLRVYPVAARLAQPVGTLMGDFLAELVRAGLRPETLELVGLSLGGHSIAFAAERLYQLTSKRPGRLTGLDPAGPCFRNGHQGLSIRPDLANRVDVLHTNIDGFGTAQPLGHVDFYANGGEYQPSSISGFILPCLTICSHFKALLYWWMAVENPYGFLAISCDSVQDARRGDCYDGQREVNILGPKTDFNKSGIFYLPTKDSFPYFAGREGLEKRYRPSSFLNDFIPSGDLIV